MAEVLAANCKTLRGKKSQPKVVEIARAHGYAIDQGTISRIERGRLTPSVEVLEALAAGLEVDPWKLLVPNVDWKNPPILLGAGGDAENALWKRIREAAKQLGIAE